MIDKRFVLLNEADNIFVCCEKVSSGEEVCFEDSLVKVNVDINVGHKVARNNLPKSEKIIKYGAPIGSTTQTIKFGEHVHMHNMKSDYIPSHTRQNKTGEAS